MRFRVLSGSEIGSERVRWDELRDGNPDLASPYFCPEFTFAAAAVRDDVRVTLLEDGGKVVGYFPHQRGRAGSGKPVGGRLSDYQGVIASPATRFDANELVAGSGLGYWEFDHLLARQTSFEAYHRVRDVSPGLDLSRGYEDYRRRRSELGTGRISQLERKERKLGREVGEVRFEPYSTDQKALERVFSWKSEQCRRTGVVDYFAFGWTRALVERIWQTREPRFRGALSVLYAGDELVAAHFGMLSERSWHWWFPVYNAEFSRYSPGGILLLKVAHAASEAGVTSLDLGKGDDDYKASFSDMEIPLAEGCVVRPSVAASIRWLRNSAERMSKGLPIPSAVKPILRNLRNRLKPNLADD